MKKTLYCFDVRSFERPYLQNSLSEASLPLEFKLLPYRLQKDTLGLIEKGNNIISTFVSDDLSQPILKSLKEKGVGSIHLRCAGFNHVDLRACKQLEIPVTRVPSYSPESVAEYTLCLILNLSRKLHKAYHRTREGDFTLDGLVGTCLHSKTIGIIGVGQIGEKLAQLLSGFGCRILGHDPRPKDHLKKWVQYVPLEELLEKSQIVSLHLPLSEQSFHIINEQTIAKMPIGAFLINTGRGALVESRALIKSLKSGHLGGAALDVYEEEERYFSQDFSDKIIQDDILARLLTFPNTIVTSHQGYLTEQALEAIAATTTQNIVQWLNGESLTNEVHFS